MERRILLGIRLRAAVAAEVLQENFSNRSLGRQRGPFAIRRQYATSNTLTGTKEPSVRKQVTVSNDDGRVPWGQLSPGEKVARTTQQTFNLGVILAGAVGLVCRHLIIALSNTNSDQAAVSYYLYIDVFSSDSKTRHFNRAVDRFVHCWFEEVILTPVLRRIRADPRALDLLGSGQTIRAFGEPTGNKWSRNRPIA